MQPVAMDGSSAMAVAERCRHTSGGWCGKYWAQNFTMRQVGVFC